MNSRFIPSALTQSVGFVVRKFSGMRHAVGAALLKNGARGSAVSHPSLLTTAMVFAMILLIPIAMLALMALLGHADPTAGVLMATAPAVVTKKRTDSSETKPAKIREMEANLKALARELEQGQLEMTAGPITQERGEELEQKAKEMEQLQVHLDQYNRIAGIVKSSRSVDKVTLPGEEGGRRKIVRTTPGHMFVGSKAFATYRAQGKQGQSGWVDIPGGRLGRHVKLVGDEAIEFERKAFDPSQLSDLGTDAIIEVDRDREIIRFEEPEILTIRDVLNVTPTSSDSIKFVRHVATDRAAASQNPRRGGAKAYLTVEFVAETVNTETIAVLSKVTEQDIDDAPRLVGYINGEMSLDIKVEEERQLLYGTGLNSQLKGLFHADFAIPEFNRAEVGDTVIDTIRKMRTDLRKNERILPSFVAIDPLDWEEVELTKGTDTHYIWGLITDLRGPRIWSLRVVESDAMTNPSTAERRILMGDGVRGATIYDRNAIRLAVGFVDDDFARNLRTLRAEERIALAVKRAFAFEYAITQEAAS